MKLIRRNYYLSKSKAEETLFLTFNRNNYISNPSITTLLLKFLLKIKNTATVMVSYHNKEFNIELPSKKDFPMLLRFENRPIKNDYPKIFTVFVEYLESDGPRRSRGVSFISVEDAAMKAFGEFVERFHGYYSPGNHALKRNPKIRQFSVKSSSLRIEQLPRPTQTQEVFKYFPKTNQDLNGIDSFLVINTTKSKKELLPKAFIFFNVKEKFFFQHGTTNGGGGGQTVEKAQLSAIYELIERDHFLLFWLTRTSPDIIDIKSLPDSFRLSLERASERFSLEFFILNTSYDCNIFSCVVAIVDPILLRVSIGGAAGANVIDVIKKAYSEALAEMHDSGVARVDISNFNQNDTKVLNSITKNIRKDIFNSEEGLRLFREIFLQGKKSYYADINHTLSRKFYSDKSELGFLISVFKSLTVKNGDGYNLYLYLHDAPLLKDHDYSFAKAFVPSFLKLWLNENAATPINSRLLKFSKEKGCILNFDEKDINPYPHPFS